MSPITKFQQVERQQKPTAVQVRIKAPEVSVQTLETTCSCPAERYQQPVSDFDCIGIRRRGNKSFVFRFETKEAENFALLLQ